MRRIKCSLSFHNYRLDTIPVFAGGVRDGIFGNNLVFATPPIGLPDVQLLIDTYLNTRYAYKQGGLAQKGPFLTAKDALMEGLDSLAEYVNTVSDGDPNIITLSGFVPTKGSVSDAPPPATPTDIKITRGEDSGELLAECNKISYAVSYVCIMTVNEPLPPDISINAAGQLYINGGPDGGQAEASAAPPTLAAIMDFNTSRKKKFVNLQPGTIYYFAFFAVNAAGVSALSNSEKLMCG